MRASTDEPGLSLVSRETLRRPYPWAELPEDLRNVPVRAECAAECVLDAELARFEQLE